MTSISACYFSIQTYLVVFILNTTSDPGSVSRIDDYNDRNFARVDFIDRTIIPVPYLVHFYGYSNNDELSG